MEQEIRLVLEQTKPGWEISGHKTMEEALTWFLSYEEAMACLDSHSTRDWIETFKYGIEPMPEQWEALIAMVEDLLVDEEQEGREEWLKRLRDFYSVEEEVTK